MRREIPQEIHRGIVHLVGCSQRASEGPGLTGCDAADNKRQDLPIVKRVIAVDVLVQRHQAQSEQCCRETKSRRLANSPSRVCRMSP